MFFDSRVFYLLTQNTFTVLNNDALVSIPLFLLMGYLVERANILDSLFKSLQIALKRIPALARGGDARHLRAVRDGDRHRRRGGDPDGNARVPADDQGRLRLPASPPAWSVPAGVLEPDPAVGHADRLWRRGRVFRWCKLYAAASSRLPLAGMYIAYVVVLAIIKPQLAPPLPKGGGRRPGAREVIVMLAKSFFPLALLILSVLGAIMFGLATPTEAAAVGAFGAMLLAAGYRALSWQEIAGIGVPHRAHLGNGVLAVRRFGDLRLGLRLPWRQRDDQGLRARHGP